MTRITALIPCYNGELFIADAVRSVLAQERRVDEVLVIDDRSTDRSAAVAQAAGATVITLSENGGPSRARNVGLRAARGDLVAFLDADDQWDPAHIRVVAGLLDEFPEAVLAFGRCAVMQLPENETVDALPARVPVNAQDRLLLSNFVPQTATIVRRAAALAAGGYDETMRHSEDYDLWLRLALAGPFVYSGEVTGWWRLHADQASRNAYAMRRGTWAARVRALTAVRRTGDTTRGRTLWRTAVEAWRHELAEAWLFESPVGLDAVLSLRREIGLPAGPYWRWKIQRHVLWRPRALARAVWRRARGVEVPHAGLIS